MNQIKSILLSLIILSFSFSIPLNENPKMEARVYFSNVQEIYAKLGVFFSELDIATRGETEKGEPYLVIITNQEQLEQIREKGLRVEITYPDIKEKFRLMTGVDPNNLDMLRSFGYFFTYWEMIDTLNHLTANYPNITQVFNPGNSYQGKPLWTIKISDNPLIDEPEPAVYINGATHAREPGATHCCIDFATYLLSNYGQDSLVTWLVNNREIYITPVMNPDGYVYNSDSGGATSNWRKNRRIIVAPNIGVDLNRNYGYRWGVDDVGSSPNPASETYRGPARFSEVETQVTRDLMFNQKIRTQMDYHTYGQYNMYPWSYTTTAPPDSLTLKETNDTFRLYNQYLLSRTGQSSRVLYLSNGCSDDWEYADTLWQGNQKFITYAFCIEWGRTDFWYGWNLPAYVDSECLKNRPNSFYLTRLAGVFFEPRASLINDSLSGNATNQLDPGETAYVWFKLRNRAVHPLDSAYQLSGKLKSLDTMVIILDSIKTLPRCLRKDSTNNRLQQFKFYCSSSTNPGRVVNLRLEMSYKDDTLTMMQPVNFSITIGSNPILIHDVGCTKIEGFSATLDSAAILTPACSVYNYGTATENYSVRMKVGNFYNRTASLAAHLPNTFRSITFPACTAYQRGVNAVSCSTELSGDLLTANDKSIGSFFTRVIDVGAVAIISPPPVVDSGQTISPQARIKNFGNATANNIPVRFNIGSWQDDTTIASLAANESTVVTFANWTAMQRGFFATKCSTRLTGDINPVNDKQTGSVSVGVRDVGIVASLLPDTVNSGAVVTPACSLFNYGTALETYNVITKLNGADPETLTVASHPPATYLSVVFAARTILTGLNIFSCSLAITDMNPNNDMMTKNVFGESLDVSTTKIIAPTGIIISGTVITPVCSLYNYGNAPVGYSVRMKIDDFYNEETLVTNHTPGTYQYITLPTWVANPVGTYVVSCSTELLGDMNLTNDKQTDTIMVMPSMYPFWEPQAQIPLGLSTRRPKSGSCMAGLEATNKIYFLKASNTQDFAMFTPNLTIGTWTLLETIPLGIKPDDGKKPKKGASMAGFDNTVYVLRGNNTPGFWEYKTTPSESIGWYKLLNIPTGAKNPKDASGLVPVNTGGTDYIFTMKGSKTDEFYLYDIANNTWAPTPTKPAVGTSGKIGYKKGSCLCYDGINTVYVMKGTYGDFFSYDLSTSTWTELKRYDYKLFINRDGKKKKIGEGSGLVYYNNKIYLLKGGNTYEFWEYDIASDSFIQMGPATDWDIPTGGGKKVKGGGCLTKLDDYFYAAKGANTPEFYRHPLPFDETAIPFPSEGAMSKKTTIEEFKVTVVPNPANKVVTIKYRLPDPTTVILKLYNIAGKLVKSPLILTPTKNGFHRINTENIPSGVYILRLITDNKTLRRKLVIKK
jgi:hypothetical protein